MSQVNSDNKDQKVTQAGDNNAPLSSGSSGQVNASDGMVFRGSGSNNEIKTTVSVDRSVTDSRNFGQQLGDVGAGATVNVSSSDPSVILAAMASQAETARFGLIQNQANTEKAFEFANASAVGAQDITARALAANQAAATNGAAVAVGALGLGGEALSANVETAKAALAGNLESQIAALDTVNKTNARAFDFGDGALDLTRSLQERNQQVTSQTINAATDQAREAAARSQSVVESAIQKLADQRAPDGANVTKLALYLGLGLLAALTLRPLFAKSKT